MKNLILCVLVLLLAAGCKREPQDKLSGQWVSSTVLEKWGAQIVGDTLNFERSGASGGSFTEVMVLNMQADDERFVFSVDSICMCFKGSWQLRGDSLLRQYLGSEVNINERNVNFSMKNLADAHQDPRQFENTKMMLTLLLKQNLQKGVGNYGERMTDRLSFAGDDSIRIKGEKLTLGYSRTH